MINNNICSQRKQILYMYKACRPINSTFIQKACTTCKAKEKHISSIQ